MAIVENTGKNKKVTQDVKRLEASLSTSGNMQQKP